MKALFCLALIFPFFISCTKNNSKANPRDSSNTSSGSTIKTSRDSISIYDSLVFSAVESDDKNQFFSTIDTTFKKPISMANLTASQKRNVDIVFVYDYEADYPCFIDPILSSTWYSPSDDYNAIYANPSLDSSVQTFYYTTNMVKNDFDSVKAHPFLFNYYFQDIYRIETIYWDPGVIIGNPTYNIRLGKGMVLGFMNGKSQKRGFIFIRYDQDHGWPDFPETGFRIHVDIIKEK